MKKLIVVLGALLIMVGCSNNPSDETGLLESQVITEQEVSQAVNNEDSIDTSDTNGETSLETDTEESKDMTKSNLLAYEPGDGVIKENGPLQVIDGQLSNAKGESIQLKGLSTHGLQWFGSFINENSIPKLVNEWNIQVLRAAMYTTEEGYISDYKNYSLMGLEKSIQLATQNGIYVIVDWHVHRDKDPMLHIDEAKEFFTLIAKKYGNYENIIYEICNEPNGDITWEENIKPYAEEMIPLIRSYDQDAVVIVGTPSWSKELDKAADNPLEFDNVLYTMHFYAGTHGQELRDVASYAMEKGIGIFVTEWGTSRSSGGGGVFIEESDVWLEFLDEHQISWSNWSISDKAESSAIFLPNVDPYGEWPEDRISESGKYVRAKLLENN